MSGPTNIEAERHWLDLQHAQGRLDEQGRWRRLELHRGPSALEADLEAGTSLGGRAASSLAVRELASKSLSERVPLVEDVHVASVAGGELKALITAASDTGAGAHITNMRAELAPQPRRRLSVLDLVRVSSTTVDAVTYARQSAFTNAAAAVTEATSTTTGTKPEATIAFSVETAAVADYALWVPVTRRSLSDVAELRSVIDSQLTDAVRAKLEAAITAAMVSAAGSTQAKGADTLLVATLKLLTTLRNLDVEPTAILLNPADYEVMRAVTTAYHSQPISVDSDGTERLFAIPLIVSASVADETAVVADMQSVSVWLRSLDVFVTDSHDDWFVRNLSAILAELRAASAVVAPAGVGTVTGWD